MIEVKLIYSLRGPNNISYIVKATGYFSVTAGTVFMERWEISPLPFELRESERKAIWDQLYELAQDKL